MLRLSPGRGRSVVPRAGRVAVALAAYAATGASACASADRAFAPTAAPRSAVTATAAAGVIVSQVYGGGGNAGSVYTHDFIELYNPTPAAVSLAGASVQYASATGTSWQVTRLTGTIAPGGYYLVQESRGNAGTTPLPAPNDSGPIAMGATAGKVALVSTDGALTGACPTANVVDFVGFGTTANCFEGTGATPAPSNTASVVRRGTPPQDTNNNAADFQTAAPPTPRNGTFAPPTAGPVVAVAVSPPTATVAVGGTVQLTATGTDSAGNPSATTFTWTSSNTGAASVSSTGVVLGTAASAAPVTITATSANGVSGTAAVTVNPAGGIASITWSGSATNITTAPVGFEAQVFTPVARDANNAAVAANFAYAALDPAVATVRPVGNSAIITAVAVGQASPRFQVTATPVGGGTPFSVTITPLSVEAATYADSASTFADNAEFGRPTNASASNLNDLLIARTTYTASYNVANGTPNWVSYELDQRQRSTGQDRCNCFSSDPVLPEQYRIYTSDYTNGGFDRGHLARSADRTVTNGENARTFYLTNIVPQLADLNQGVWAAFENRLADSAAAGRAVYIITGPIYSGTPRYIKQDSGFTKVRIPDSTWKVAFIGPIAAGAPFRRGTIQSWDDLAGTTVLAVNMPNVSGIRNDDPSRYSTTVDAIERSTGYDFLSLLQTQYQAAVEAGDRAPVPVLNAPAGGAEGDALAFNAAGTVDPDAGDVLTYAFDFGDGTTAAGASATHAYADNGMYTVKLTVTDRFGWAVTRTRAVAVTNAAPAPTLTPAATTVAAGQAFNPQARFADAGAGDGPWRATVAWGDGTSTTALLSVLPTGAIRASHAYTTAGTYTVRFTVTDKDGASASVERTVTVTAAAQ